MLLFIALQLFLELTTDTDTLTLVTIQIVKIVSNDKHDAEIEREIDIFLLTSRHNVTR